MKQAGSLNDCKAMHMCISCPQRVLSFRDGLVLVEFQGRKRKVKSPISLSKGDYVLCQAGLVVRKIPESTAREMHNEWSEFNEF
jgi:hydrogenase maturation factor